MPLYEYNCKECNANFEAIAPHNRADQMDCEYCGSSAVERLASVFASSIEGDGGGLCGKPGCPPMG